MATRKKKVAKATKTITLPPIQWGRLLICIEGVTPLLMNKFSNKAFEEIEGKQTGKARAKKAARDPEREIEDAIHRDEAGWPCFPSTVFKNALVRAGDMVEDLPMVKLKRIMFVWAPPEQLVRVYGRYDRHNGTVRINNGPTIPRYRPIWDEWGIEFYVDYVKNEITEEIVYGLADRAFLLGGIGDGRPTSPKNHGMENGRAKLVSDINRLKKKQRKPQLDLP